MVQSDLPENAFAVAAVAFGNAARGKGPATLDHLDGVLEQFAGFCTVTQCVGQALQW